MIKRIQIAVSLLISIVCLYFAFRNINWVETWDAICRANYFYILLTVLVTLGSVWLRAYRWKFMLDPIRRVPVGGLYQSTMIGFMANNVLPARLGEFVRAYAVGKAHGVSKSAAFATIVIERAFDMLTLVFCLGIVILLVKLSPQIKFMGTLAIAVTFVMFGVLVFFRQRRDLVVRIVERLTRSLPEASRNKGGRLLHSFIDGLEVLAKGGHILAILGLSLVMWGSVMLSFDLTMRAFNLPVPFYASIVLLVVVSLGLMIPSGPGFAGTFEAATIWALLLFDGVTKEQAASFAIVYHATQFIPITALGLYYLWKSNLSLTDASADGGSA
ncbi:MAG: lysylphosphatidylglycerol synthase transmembrane domain-containing protein [Candidatus Eisenbacteria bacterium]|nr:lysylphosphatidylglycerol synthase transmembrane domain-containing protein [Candidatus Eisenbacteria bacterium]